MMRKGVWILICAGALTFGCTHTHMASDDGSPDPEDVAKPAENSGGLPPAPPDPLGKPGLPPPSDPGTPPPAPKKKMLFGVDENANLVSFPLDDPGAVKSAPITGLEKGERVLGIDFRPSNGKLYGLGSTSRLYTIDPDKAAATAVAATPFTPALSGQSFGFDFDPKADGIRVHSDVDQDLMLHPDLGTVAGVDPMLAFATNDVNAFQHLNIVGTAFTAKSDLYAIDSTRNLLVQIADPYSGRAATLGSLGVVATDVAGFDIAPSGEAYAALRVSDKTGLYTIDLTTGKAELAGTIGVTTGLHGLALAP
jgi:hypothetical protein